MRVQVVDPSAYTPPYDRALSGALARAGADVELVTSRFAYGDVPPAEGYRVCELFYRRAGRYGAADRARFPTKLVEHVPDMLRYRRHARSADVVHWQWFTVQPVDAFLLPPKRPRGSSSSGRPASRASRRAVARTSEPPRGCTRAVRSR